MGAMVPILVTLLLKAGVILGVARITPGVRVDGYGTALVVAVTYALLQWALKSILVALTLPLVLLTLGLFLLALNGFLLWITDKLVPRFAIRGLPALALATLGVTIGSLGVEALVGKLF
jgi:putative membrane protein